MGLTTKQETMNKLKAGEELEKAINRLLELAIENKLSSCKVEKGGLTQVIQAVQKDNEASTRELLEDLVQQLKDFTNEGKTILGHDDREPIEFVDIFLKTKTTIE